MSTKNSEAQMTEHRGTCSKCGEEKTLIVYGWSTLNDKHCFMCNWARQNKTKGEAVKPRFPVVKKSVISSSAVSSRLVEKRDHDWVVNNQIWDTRPHKCEECQKPLAISPPPKIYFSHLLGKGAHPELRFDPLNIVLHCSACHRDWETSGKMREMRTYALHSAYMIENGFVPKGE